MSGLTLHAKLEPALPAGSYKVRVGQRLTVDGVDLGFGDTSDATVTDAASLRFASHGPRVALPAAMILAQYPVPGSTGHEAGVLPHVQLGDPSLPWLRSRGGARRLDPDPPWLALVLLGGDEIGRVERRAVTAHDLRLDDEPGQRPDEVANLLSIPYDLATQLLPTGDDMDLLVHVRESPVGAEMTSVVVCNRMVVPSAVNEVHLISVENRDLDNLAKGVDVEVISLAQWSFQSVDAGPGFRELAMALAHNFGPLRYSSGDATADGHGQRGVLLLRNGSGASFYRGPLAPSTSDPIRDLIVSSFDNATIRDTEELVVYDELLGVTDVSYAVAYDLGRSLMLADPDLVASLSSWRQAVRRRGLLAGQLHGLHEPQLPPLTVPPRLDGWSEALLRLELVPARYLLPDPERLLPLSEATWVEPDGSSRRAPGRLACFDVDYVWVALLALGAVSVIAATEAERSDGAAKPWPMQGFLLRSPLVRWSDLELTVHPGSLDAFDPTKASIEIRQRDLAQDIRLVLFDTPGSPPGPVVISIGRHPSGAHFGITEPDPVAPKTLPPGVAGSLPVAVPQRAGTHATVVVAALAKALGATDSAQLAGALIVASPVLRLEMALEGA